MVWKVRATVERPESEPRMPGAVCGAVRDPRPLHHADPPQYLSQAHAPDSQAAIHQCKLGGSGCFRPQPSPASRGLARHHRSSRGPWPACLGGVPQAWAGPTGLVGWAPPDHGAKTGDVGTPRRAWAPWGRWGPGGGWEASKRKKAKNTLYTLKKEKRTFFEHIEMAIRKSDQHRYQHQYRQDQSTVGTVDAHTLAAT